MRDVWFELQHLALTPATHWNAAVLDACGGKQCVVGVVGPTIWAHKRLPVGFCEVGVSARWLQDKTQKQWKNSPDLKQQSPKRAPHLSAGCKSSK
jgi:hypothetical protein